MPHTVFFFKDKKGDNYFLCSVMLSCELVRKNTVVVNKYYSVLTEMKLFMNQLAADSPLICLTRV